MDNETASFIYYKNRTWYMFSVIIARSPMRHRCHQNYWQHIIGYVFTAIYVCGHGSPNVQGRGQEATPYVLSHVWTHTQTTLAFQYTFGYTPLFISYSFLMIFWDTFFSPQKNLPNFGRFFEHK